jgi:hypothetical protein
MAQRTSRRPGVSARRRTQTPITPAGDPHRLGFNGHLRDGLVAAFGGITGSTAPRRVFLAASSASSWAIRRSGLTLLLQVVKDERGHQTLFEALDTKAGIVLAAAGVIITLAPNIATQWVTAERSWQPSRPSWLSLRSGLAASARSSPPRRARTWPTPEEAKLMLLDTIEEMNSMVAAVLGKKGSTC